MRRLALLIATSVLGIGCGTSGTTCPLGNLTVRWPSFLLANGTVTPSCGTAGATYVDVFLDDQPVQQGGFACTAGGATIVGVQPGGHILTVEGVAPNGSTILLRDDFNVSACGDAVVDAQPAEGTFQLAYSFTPANVCTAGGSYIWFSVYDQIARAVTAVADETANPTAYVCGDTIQFALPVGPYTLQRVEEAVPTGGSTYIASAANCNPTSFSIGGALQSVVSVALADSTSFCP